MGPLGLGSQPPKQPDTPILCGDHAEFEQRWAGKDPKARPDWPYPSFDAQDWAAAFVKVNPGFDEGIALAWFANALMRGFDEGTKRAALERAKSPAPGNSGL